MSADEIRRLAADALSNGIKIRDELLKHAAMVERCENQIARLPYPPNGNDVCLFEKLNYILKGATNEHLG